MNLECRRVVGTGRRNSGHGGATQARCTVSIWETTIEDGVEGNADHGLGANWVGAQVGRGVRAVRRRANGEGTHGSHSADTRLRERMNNKTQTANRIELNVL